MINRVFFPTWGILSISARWVAEKCQPPDPTRRNFFAAASAVHCTTFRI
jgi:hypothetical protein